MCLVSLGKSPACMFRIVYLFLKFLGRTPPAGECPFVRTYVLFFIHFDQVFSERFFLFNSTAAFVELTVVVLHAGSGVDAR